MKSLALLATLAPATASFAQDLPAPTALLKAPSFSIRVGGGFGGDFLVNNNSVHSSGPEIALMIPLEKLLGFDTYFEPSYFGGGRLAHGSDIDTDVFRFTYVAQHSITSSLYLKVGGGFAVSHVRSGGTNDASGLVGELGVGGPITIPLLSRYAPGYEVVYFAAGDGQLRGGFAGFTFKF